MTNRSNGFKSLFGALIVVAFISASGGLLAQQDAAPKYQEGVHYTAIENAPAVKHGDVVLVEAFSYMCTHCATFEPYISSWLKRKPQNVVFKRVPVVFGRGSWEIYARAYVTAEVMGVAEQGHAALMDKIWKDREVLRSLEELADFYAAYGTVPSEFIATSKSFAVDARMRKEQRDLQTAGVRGTPSLIVNDRYMVRGNAAVANYDVMLDVVDFLVARETAEANANAPVAEESAVAPAAEAGAAEAVAETVDEAAGEN